MPGQRPPESCQPPPDPPIHSPRIARAATMRRSRFLHRAGAATDLAGGAHADADQRAEQIRGDGEPRAFGDAVDVADEFESAAGSEDCREQFGETCAGAFDARRHEAGGDHGRLEQTEIVAAEIEDLVEVVRQAEASRSTLARRITGSSMTRK